MSQTAPRRPRTWVLWVVRTAIFLTTLIVGVGAISSIWLGKATGSFWWMVMALPQVTIALLAVLICWTPDSRPTYLGINVMGLLMFGILFAVMFLKWLPLVIGVLAIIALFVRPRGKPFIEESPPPAGWPRL